MVDPITTRPDSIPSAEERVDAVVLGGSIRGLVAAYLLQNLGYRVVLLERGPRVGGADGSFLTRGGSQFDFGLHVLDYMRTELSTRLFEQVVDGRVHRQTLRRAIVLRNQVMPYNPSREEMPEELGATLPAPGADGVLVDDLAEGELPTRERLTRFYGRAFADLVFDDVLPSYPTENRHQAFGVDPSRLLGNIYPWFFPRAQRRRGGWDQSRAFHDRLRAGSDQDILYPMEGGFGGFAAGFLRKFDPARVEVLTGCGDLQVDVELDTHRFTGITAGGRRFAAKHYFWAAAWPPLCGLLGLPCQEVTTDQVVLGSFTLDRPAHHGGYHEILVGDRSHRINRVSFPATFREADDPLMQIEFAYPRAEDWPEDGEIWRRDWIDSARRLGLLDPDHRVVEFDFKSIPLHFNVFGAEGEPLVDADPGLLHPDSNVRPVVPSMANLNLNAYVPMVVRDVAASLAAEREA